MPETGAILYVFIFFGATLGGFFLTKTKGWGKFSTSTLLLILVLFAATVAFVHGDLKLEPLTNLLFAIAGFAGALLTGKEINGADAERP